MLTPVKYMPESVLNDPKKKSSYDKYGKIEEDDFNFDQFMKEFNFENIFEMFEDEDFGRKVKSN